MKQMKAKFEIQTENDQEEIIQSDGKEIIITLINGEEFAKASDFFDSKDNKNGYQQLCQLTRLESLVPQKVEGDHKSNYYDFDVLENLAKQVLEQKRNKANLSELSELRRELETPETTESKNKITFDNKEITPINIKLPQEEDFITDKNGIVVSFCSISNFFHSKNDTVRYNNLLAKLLKYPEELPKQQVGKTKYYDSKIIHKLALEVLRTSEAKEIVEERKIKLGDRDITIKILKDGGEYLYPNDLYPTGSQYLKKLRSKLDQMELSNEITGIVVQKRQILYPYDQMIKIYNELESE
jgi:hypothetical protein